MIVANCLIINAQWRSYRINNSYYLEYGRGITIEGDGNRSSIFNNYIRLYQNTISWPNNDLQYVDSDGGCGIRVSGPIAKIYNNVILGSNYGITAPYAISASNNIIASVYRGLNRGGIVPENTITQSPVYIPSSDYVLQATSPGIDQGVTDPIFNDFDGTRNDIGIWGGCLYDPEGRTANKPIVITFDIAPQQLLKGVDTDVNLSNGEAVAQP